MEMSLEKRSRQQKKKRWGPTTRGGGGGSSSFGRLPRSPGTWHQSVPLWEKKFCTSICSIPWGKLCETKKLMYMYPAIVEWNDSEGEEAFHNAKARYWAEINHLPCPAPLPDPNMYIECIDENTAVVDPELVEDLYKQPPVSPNAEGDNEIVWDSFRFTIETVPISGWGDSEDQEQTVYATDQSIPIQPTGWGDDDDQLLPLYATGQLIQIQPTGWGDEEEDIPPICTTDQSIPIQPTGWGNMENPTNEINHEDQFAWNDSEANDNCGDYQRGRDFSWHPGSTDSCGAWEYPKSVS